MNVYVHRQLCYALFSLIHTKFFLHLRLDFWFADSLVGSSAVFDQEVELDDHLEELAEKYGITPGKATLIRRVVEAHPGMDYDMLARLSMKKLTEYLTGSDVDIRDYANYTGTPFENSDRDDDFD